MLSVGFCSPKPISSQRASSLHCRNHKSLKELNVEEEFQIAAKLSLDRFYHSDQKELEFPSCLKSSERTFVHRWAKSVGYISKSHGIGTNRYLTIIKQDCRRQLVTWITLSSDSLEVLRDLVLRFPTSSFCGDLQGSELLEPADSGVDRNKRSWLLHNGIPTVPQRRSLSLLDSVRRSLPVFDHQGEILQLLRENRVLLVLGDTGSGKTTQIPQFVLDECSQSEEACRIFCIQPRGLAAISVAQRVAAERGESVGQTVGYHIRLESRVSPKTVLTFCTCQVFLRTLMCGDANLTTVTHIIVDEVHERSGLTDFLLTKLRDVLQSVPSLKLILSSAALDVDLFRRYFASCSVVKLTEKQFKVQEFFLEDVLRLMDLQDAINNIHSQQTLNYRKERKKNLGSVEEDSRTSVTQKESCSTDELDSWLLEKINSCISNMFLHEDQEAFSDLFKLCLHHNVNVNCQHSGTGCTPLMAAASRGFLSQLEQLLLMGADVHVEASNGWTALDFARHFQQPEAVELLHSFISPGMERHHLEECGTEQQELLNLDILGCDDHQVNLDLLMDLLHIICCTTAEGATLIFLPGYNEIVKIKERILHDDKRFSTHPEKFELLTLHSDMQTLDHRKLRISSPAGVRKIILSTDVAETYITMDDVVFVIDSGVVREKYFDAVIGASTLKTFWISRSSALQRMGRAGRRRPGLCFHLFTRSTFNQMTQYQVPQLLRMPLLELCLQTKLLTPSCCPVVELLSRAPQPPPPQTICQAVQLLKAMEAMDQQEKLTALGLHLADLSIEPHLGKMVLCAVVLKCLDPVLTIACTLAHQDPFTPPDRPPHTAFSCSTYSDHMALLRAFQAWQKARSEGWERSFCEKNFLSQATMELILGLRVQLLGQLRAIGFVRAHGGSDIRDVNVNSDRWSVVKAALVAGMYPHVINVHQGATPLSSHRARKISFHPTSVLSRWQSKQECSGSSVGQVLPTDWLVYGEMVQQGEQEVQLCCCSMVTPITVALFSGGARLTTFSQQGAAERNKSAVQRSSDSEDDDLACLTIDHWHVFHLHRQAARLLFVLRHKWLQLFFKRMSSPSKLSSPQDEAVVDCLLSVLEAEELAAGLQQPAGVGQRPRLMFSNGGLHTSTRTSSTRTSNQQSPRTSAAVDVAQLREQAFPTSHLLKDLNVCVTSSSSTSSSSTSSSSTSSSSTSSSSHSSPEQVPGSGGLLSSSARYFIVKSDSVRKIMMSQLKGVWWSSATTEKKLSQAFQQDTPLLLFFSVHGSGSFQGFARMASAVHQQRSEWEGCSGVFSVDWISRESLSFQSTKHISNLWNGNNKLPTSRDEQELEPQVGSQLLSLWEKKSQNAL
ncbi:3'-5' RNA helicase YTHDC2 isoform X2 [Nelusetta ayraudi]|uniref:3'-5' RNA helicase YTHDC2 isoform X2 n=1 Tax=Nelusetta ayraudi TaxID=303726 RepID=UPI003F6F4A37